MAALNMSFIPGENISSNWAGIGIYTTDETYKQVVDVVDAIYIFVFGICLGSTGNILILLVIGLSKELQTTPNTFLASIAISDLIITAEAFPVIFANNVERRHVLAGPYVNDHTACMIQGGIHLLSVSVSLYSITLVAINRFLCVCKPEFYKVHVTMKTSIIANIVVWIWCIVSVALVVLSEFVRQEYNPYLTACGMKHSGMVQYVYISNVVSVYVPMAVTLGCYIGIYHKIKSSSNRVKSHGHLGDSCSAKNKEVAVTLLLFMTYAVFLICWLPYTILCYVALYTKVSPLIYKITVRMCMSNACANSVVYGLFNRRFRKEYKRVILLPCKSISSRRVLMGPRQNMVSAA